MFDHERISGHVKGAFVLRTFVEKGSCCFQDRLSACDELIAIFVSSQEPQC